MIIGVRSPLSLSQRCMAIIAILIMSALVPWIGAFIAYRSAALRAS